METAAWTLNNVLVGSPRFVQPKIQGHEEPKLLLSTSPAWETAPGNSPTRSFFVEKGTLWGCAFFYVLHTKSAKRVCDQKTSAFSHTHTHTHLLRGTICWEGIKNLETTTKNQTKNKESKIPKNPKIRKSKKSKNPKNPSIQKNTHLFLSQT